MSRLGSIIGKHRRREGLTLADVAGRAGVSVSFLSEVERGLRRCSAATAVAISAAANLDADVARHLWIGDAGDAWDAVARKEGTPP